MNTDLITPTINHNNIEKTQASIFKIIYSPIREFEKIKENPIISRPLLILIFLQILITFFTSYSSIDQTVIVDILKDIHTTPERLKLIIAILSAITSIFNMLFLILISSIFYKIITIIFQKDIPFKILLSFFIYLGIIPILGLFFNGLLSFILNINFTSFTNFGFLFEKSSIPYTIITSLDFFYLWHFTLIGIVLYVIMKLSKFKIAITMISLLTLNILFGIISEQLF